MRDMYRGTTGWGAFLETVAEVQRLATCLVLVRAAQTGAPEAFRRVLLGTSQGVSSQRLLAESHAGNCLAELDRHCKIRQEQSPNGDRWVVQDGSLRPGHAAQRLYRDHGLQGMTVRVEGQVPVTASFADMMRFFRAHGGGQAYYKG